MAGKNKRRNRLEQAHRRREDQRRNDERLERQMQGYLNIAFPTAPFKVALQNGEAEVAVTRISVEHPSFGKRVVWVNNPENVKPPPKPGPTGKAKDPLAEQSTEKLPQLAEERPTLTTPEPAKSTSYESTLHRVDGWFSLASTLVPKRIADEEIGDAHEQIHEYVAEGRPRLHIYAKAISAIFWLIIHAIGDISATLQGKNKKAK